jgi:hypothetical protein
MLKQEELPLCISEIGTEELCLGETCTFELGATEA